MTLEQRESYREFFGVHYKAIAACIWKFHLRMKSRFAVLAGEEDLWQIVALAILQSPYDSTIEGNKNYVRMRAVGALIEEVRKYGQRRTGESGRHCLILDEVPFDNDELMRRTYATETPEKTIDIINALRRGLPLLTERERRVLELSLNGETLKDIGKGLFDEQTHTMGVTEGRACQIMSSARKKLQQFL